MGRKVSKIRLSIEALAKVLKEKSLSFPRKWESSLFNVLQNLWIPVFTGMTTFARASIIRKAARIHNWFHFLREKATVRLCLLCLYRDMDMRLSRPMVNDIHVDGSGTGVTLRTRVYIPNRPLVSN